MRARWAIPAGPSPIYQALYFFHIGVRLAHHGSETMAGIRKLATACAALLISAAANAQTMKSGTLSLVVPFASGGPSDVAGRILAQGMAETLGQTVVVENPVGGGGTVGSLRVSRSTPDGSQFVLGNNGTHSWSQSLYKVPPYDAIKDFTPLGLAVAARHHRADDAAGQHPSRVHC